MILIVAGVAGTGKTTLGTLLAERLGWPFVDGDTFHPEANIAKMRSGTPLTDADRAPWLRAVGAWIDAQIAAGRSGVITCSALKRSIRERLLAGRPAKMVFLEVSKGILAQRLQSRHDHFFRRNMLDSQFAVLELPTPDEHVLVLHEHGEAVQTAEEIIHQLWPDGLDGVAWTGEADAGPTRHL